MNRRSASSLILLLTLSLTTLLSVFTGQVMAAGTIYIRADGSIDPPGSPMITYDNVTYTLTGNVTVTGSSNGIVVERDNIVIDGAGFTIQGIGVVLSWGIKLVGRTNVTVQNARIDNFYYGIGLSSSDNDNIISGNTITASDYGIYLSSSNYNIIVGNNITNNDLGVYAVACTYNNISGNTITAKGYGIQLYSSCNYNIISGNDIANRTNSYPYGIFLEFSCNYNNISGNNIADCYTSGIFLEQYCDHNNINGNTVTASDTGIRFYTECDYNSVSQNNLTANTYYGMDADTDCSNNIFSENNISECWTGFNFEDCSNNSLIGNTVRDVTETAIIMDSCSNMTLRLNSIVNATRSFEIWSGWEGNEMLSHYMHNIEDSNTINGKPVYYWTSERDRTVPAGAGFVALVNCTNVRVYNQSLSRSGTGLLVAFTQNSKICANKISGCLQTVATKYYGMRLISSHGNIVFDNELSYNDYGIELTDGSTSNTVVGNRINASTYDGISLWYSDENSICGNEIQNSGQRGLNLHSSNLNLIYGNDLGDADTHDGTNTWDKGYPTGGNYWSGYWGSDANGDGIGDTPYIIDDANQDNFPLMSSEKMFEMPLPLAFFSYRINYTTNSVTFDASASSELLGSIVNYSWDFGDGQSGTGVTVSHVYDFNVSESSKAVAVTQADVTQADMPQDAYDVTLTVTNDKGRRGSQTRKVGIGNLFADYAMPMQVFTIETQLVRLKRTDFSISYESAFKVPVSASIKLDAPGYMPTSYTIDNVVFYPGDNEIILKSPLVPYTKPTAKVRFIIDPQNAIGETDETDNTSDFDETPVVDTKPLSVLFVPVRFKDEDGYPGRFTGYSREDFRMQAWESMKYIGATYPVVESAAGLGSVGGSGNESETSYQISCTNSPVTCDSGGSADPDNPDDFGRRPTTKEEADAAFESIAKQLAARAGGRYDRVVGVVRPDWFKGIPGYENTVGFAVTTCPTACVVILGDYSATAHELGHTYGLGHSNDNCTVGYYAAGMQELPPTQTWMSTGAIPYPPAQPSYRVPVPGFWVTMDEYKNLTEKMKLPTDPELMFFSATFWKNGTVKTDDWYHYSNGWPTYTEADSGNYSLVQLDGVGTVLSTVGFNVTFENVISEYPDYIFSEVNVAFTVPYAAGTKTIQIRDQLGTVVASKTVSDNAPTVTVTSPNGGEVLTSDHVQVSWTASDIDEDSLVYNLEVSGDGGVTWDPVASGLTETTYDLILTGFRGGDKYLVKVVASDGVNTAEDVSDYYFTISSFSVEIISETESVQMGSKAYVLLKVASYGGFNNPITLHATCSAVHQLGYNWILTSTVNPAVNGYTVAVLEVTFNTTQTGIYTLYLSGSSGSNTEVATIDFLVELGEPTSDTTSPTTSDDYDGLWHTTGFTITLAATDDMSGVAETYYQINDGPTKTVSADGHPQITTEGSNNKLEYWSIDNDGNEESPHKILTEIKLDKTAPTGSITINDGSVSTNSTSVTLTLTAEDATSGAAQMRFSNDNATWSSWETYAASKAWTLTTGDGSKTVYYQIKDNAGLVSTTYSATITLSTPSPPPPAEPFPTIWIVGIAVAIIAIAALAILLLRKRK